MFLYGGGMCKKCVDMWFHKLRVWKIGNGHITRFWEDSWLEGDTLASFFLRLYNNSLQHGVCIEKMGRWASGKCEWAFSWRRSWFVWESLMVDPFMGKLQNCNFVQGVPNVWVWSTDNSSSFSAKSTYATLHDLRLGSKLDETLRRV